MLKPASLLLLLAAAPAFAGEAGSGLDRLAGQNAAGGSIEAQAVNARFESSSGRGAVSVPVSEAPALPRPGASSKTAQEQAKPDGSYPSEEKASLADKAKYFQERTDREHRPWLGLILSRRLNPDGSFAHYDNYGDSLIWTGNYVAAQAYRYGTTGDEEALARMEESLWGLHADMMATGVPGLPARVVVPKSEGPKNGFMPGGGHRDGAGEYKDYLWEGDNSFDSYTGYTHGIAVAWPFIRDPRLREAIREDMLQMGLHIIRNDMRMVGPDTFLDFRANYYYQDRFPKALRGLPLPPWRAGCSLHGLHMMKTAAEITGDPRLKAYYEEEMILKRELDLKIKEAPNLDEIVEKNKGLISKVMRAWSGEDVQATAQSLRTNIGLDLSHMAFHDLIRLETDPLLKREYSEALLRNHAIARGEGNSYWNFELASVVPGQDSEIAGGVDTLRRFPMRRHAFYVKNSEDPAIPKYKGLHGEELLPWKYFTDKPLPFEKRNIGAAWAWQNNPYELDGGDPENDQGSGTDYLVAYWMARYYGWIGPDQ